MKFDTDKCTRFFSLIVVAFLVIGSASVYAQVFTDVPNGHWANPYVEKMYRKGIISGSGDATFRPNNYVTKEQAMVMIYNMLDISSSDVRNARNKYDSTMSRAGVSSWARDAVASAIQSGIVSEQEVRERFNKNGSPQNAFRYELCVYLTRAMDLEQEAKNKIIIDLPFIDRELMPLQVQAYVEVMVDKGVINKKGDSEGKFNPKKPISRAEMAKMLSVAYDYIDRNNIKPDVPEEIDDDLIDDAKKIEGTIYSMFKSTGHLYITIKDEDGDKDTYILHDDAKIEIDGRKSDAEDITEGLELKEARVTRDKKVVLLEANSIEEEYTGEIDRIYDGKPYKIRIEYKEDEDDDDDDTEKKTFEVDEDADIRLNGEKADVDELDDEDKGEFKVKNSKIVEIDVKGSDWKLEGTIKKIIFDPEPEIVVIDEDDNEYKFDVDKRVDIERNNRDAEITDLRKGDEVELDIEYDVVTDIEADVVEDDDEGTVTAINISSTGTTMTIRDDDGDEKTYDVAKGVDLKIDRKTSTIYDLKLGYSVEVEIEGNEVVEIDAISRNQNDRYEGIIEWINSKADVITISTINASGDKENIRIDVDSRTTYIDEDGDETSLRRLDEGDEILVIGNYEEGVFTAKTVIIVQEY